MRGKVGRLFAGELNRSDLVLPPGEGGGQPPLLTPTGLSLTRLTVTGALTEVERQGGDYLNARVADPTGAFSLSSGWHRPEVTGALSRIEPPAFVAVTASLRFTSRTPAARPVLLPEAVAEVDRAARDTWVITTAEMTLGRLERLAAVLSGTGGEPALAMAVDHYRITPPLLLEFADMVGTALDSVMAGMAGMGSPAGRDPRELVLAYLAARPKEAVPLETILAELGRQGIDTDSGSRAVKKLLAEGECYMPRKGYVRLA